MKRSLKFKISNLKMYTVQHFVHQVDDFFGKFIDVKNRDEIMSIVKLEIPSSFHIALFFFCLHVAASASKSTRKMNYFHGSVYTALSAFGGGILVPLLVGHNDYYPFPLKDEYAIPILVLAYSLYRWSRSYMEGFDDED